VPLVLFIGYPSHPSARWRIGSLLIKMHLASSFSINRNQSVISGAKKERPELNMLLSQIRDGDQLVIDKLSRLGRSLKDLIQIVSDLEDRGVTFISLKDAIDTSSASGRVRPTLDAEVKIPSLNVHLVHSLRCSSFSLTSLHHLQSLSEI